MGIQQRLRGIFKAAKNNAKGLTLIEFSIVLAMTIALIGLVLSSTGVFGLVDRYYIKTRVESAMLNYGAATGDTLVAAGGGFDSTGLLGTVDAASTEEVFTAEQMGTFCSLQKQAGALSSYGGSAPALLYTGLGFTMGGASAAAVCPD